MEQRIFPVILRMYLMRINSFRFNLQELGGAVGDLGTLLPLMVALILVNGLNATSVLVGVGLFYIISGLYYRIPMPVQPLKVVSSISISLGLSASVIGAAGLLMGGILLLLSFTNFITTVAQLFPRAVVKGIQFSVGLILFRKAIEFTFGETAFISGSTRFLGLGQFHFGIILAALALLIFALFKFVIVKQGQRFPPSLAMLIFGLGAGTIFGPVSGLSFPAPSFPSVALPAAADFWLAFTVLVIPQLPLTLGNAVVSTWDTAKTYFPNEAHLVTPRALTTSMGLANVASGLFGAMPMCHGSGGLTAHYKLGARTGAANIMIGGFLLVLGASFGYAALSFLSLIPLSVLGILLAIIGIYHTLLIRELKTRSQLAVAGAVAVVTILLGNLALGVGVGIMLYYLLKLLPKASSSPPSSSIHI